MRYWSGAALAVGGRNGTAPRYGAPIANPLSARQMLFTRPESGTIWVGGDTPLLRGPAAKWPDLDYVYNPLVTVPEVDIRAPDADVVRVDAGPLQRSDFAVPPDPGSHFRVTITLFELFNEVRSERSWNTAPAPPLVCAGIRRRTLLYLPGTIPAFEFACAIAPNAATVPTERSLTLVATVTARPATSLQWDVYGGAANGTVRQTPAGASYTAPTTAPSSAVAVRAAATLDPSRFEDAMVTVAPGIALASSAASGMPANPAIASANVDQTVGISIPGAVFTQTGEAFAVNQDVEFEVFDSPTRLTPRRTAVQSSTAVGMQALSVRVPEHATPVHSVRVVGHGSARLQIVPVITSIEPHPTSFPNIFINGTGFDGRSIAVVFITGVLAPAQIISVRSDRIEVAIRPAPGSEVRVRTDGGTSAGFVMP